MEKNKINERIERIKKRIKKEYVFDEAGEVVIGMEADLEWTIEVIAQLEERLEEIARIVANRGIPPKHEVALGQLLTIGRIALGDKEESSVASNDET